MGLFPSGTMNFFPTHPLSALSTFHTFCDALATFFVSCCLDLAMKGITVEKGRSTDRFPDDL